MTMLAKLGLTEGVIVVAVLLVLFGPSRLPQLSKSIGKGIKEFLSRLL
jgi:sec-independent protein translocase protein TatA